MIDERKEQIEQTEIVASEQASVKRKWCVVAIIGFCVSALAALIDVIAVLSVVIAPSLGTVIWLILLLFFCGALAIVGLILSVIGLVVSIKRKKRGKVFAIIGIVLCVAVMLIMVFMR